MTLKYIKVITAAAGLGFFSASCSRSPQSAETTPLPSSTTKDAQVAGNESSGSNQTTGQGSTEERFENDNEQAQGSTAEANTTATPNSDSQRSTSTQETAATASRSAKTCLEELQGRFGPDIVFPAQQLFPKQYELARTRGAGGTAALKQTLGSATCQQLKSKE